MGSNVASVCQRHNKSAQESIKHIYNNTLCAFYKSRCAFCVCFFQLVVALKCVYDIISVLLYELYLKMFFFSLLPFVYGKIGWMYY